MLQSDSSRLNIILAFTENGNISHLLRYIACIVIKEVIVTFRTSNAGLTIPYGLFVRARSSWIGIFALKVLNISKSVVVNLDVKL